MVYGSVLIGELDLWYESLFRVDFVSYVDDLRQQRVVAERLKNFHWIIIMTVRDVVGKDANSAYVGICASYVIWS